jgi:hypothetical protein
MKRAARSTVDLRGFAWPLASLESKLAQDAELAGLQLAGLRRDAAGIEASLSELARARGEQLLAVTSAPGHAFDPSARSQALRYLAQVDHRAAQCRAQAAALQERIAAAAAACALLERRLACVRRLRDNAEDAYAQEQLRRAAREADRAWLALHWRRGDAQGGCI